MRAQTSAEACKSGLSSSGPRAVIGQRILRARIQPAKDCPANFRLGSTAQFACGRDIG